MSGATSVHEPGVDRVDEAVIELYQRSARHYDRLNAVASLGTSNWYRRRTILSLDLEPDARLLDVGCGTGALAIAAQRFLPESPSIVGVDPCPEMRRIAAAAGVRDVRAGSLESIPVDDASFDALVSGYAIRYADDLDAAFEEMRRVLAPGAPVAILEMIVPRGRTARRITQGLVRGIGANILGAACGGRDVRDLMRHFWDSICSFEPPDSVVSRMSAAGFDEAEYRPAGGLLGEFRAVQPR
ncbi:MAG: class I SAM-dependent methyltransferase [Planctomycetota bacterium]|nr:class I SAM-dependent methyltransferase [Planctomycetota bacterium]